MAYFRSNEPDQNMPYEDMNSPQGQAPQPSWAEYQPDYQPDYQPEDDDTYYDDGFDELTEEDKAYEDKLLDEEIREIRKQRFQTAFDISNLTATVIGAVLVLLLLRLLFSMIDYVKTDFEMNFSLLMSRL